MAEKWLHKVIGISKSLGDKELLDNMDMYKKQQSGSVAFSMNKIKLHHTRR